MIITSELAAKIKERLRLYVNSYDDASQEAIKAALAIEALPIYLDAGGIFAIKPTGEIVTISWDNPSNIQSEDDTRISNIVLFQGSKMYPELMSLISPKPTDAELCPYCSGTGIAPAPIGVSSDQLVCYCGGLGWIP